MAIAAFRLHLAPVTPQILSWTFLQQGKNPEQFSSTSARFHHILKVKNQL